MVQYYLASLLVCHMAVCDKILLAATKKNETLQDCASCQHSLEINNCLPNSPFKIVCKQDITMQSYGNNVDTFSSSLLSGAMINLLSLTHPSIMKHETRLTTWNWTKNQTKF